MARSKALRKAPRTTVMARRYIVGNGTPQAAEVSMFTYNIGTCPDATIDNPHNIGTQAATCAHCWSVA